MNLLIIDIDLRDLLRAAKMNVPQKPVVKHRVKNRPESLLKQFNRYWFGKVEPSDSWPPWAIE